MNALAAMGMNADGLGESLAAAVARGEGAGFLDALRGALPPELEGLSAEELLDWLRDQADSALAFMTPPTLPSLPQETLAVETARLPQDPEALLGLLLSSRGEAAGLSGEIDKLAQAALLAQAGEAEPDRALQPLLSPQALQALAPTGAGGAAASPLVAGDIPGFSLGTPVTDPGFGQALGDRLVWMLRQDVQQARIHLDPAQLGPLEISVSIKDDAATIVIHAQHAVTRDVLEADSARLRSMLGESGFSTVDVNVARDDSRQPGEQRAPAPRASFAAGVDAEVEIETGRVLHGRGLVDHYA